MKDTVASPPLGKPPLEYDPQYFSNMIRNLELHLNQLRDVGPIRVSTINISSLPTSATGLRSGDLWNDTGTVKVVT